MRWRAVLLFATLFAAPAYPQGVDPALTLGTWEVLEISGTPAAFAEMMQFSDSTVAGKGACNRFFAPAKQTGQVLEIGRLASTHMHCEGQMDAEMRYFTALQAVRSYAMDGDVLSLVAADGLVLLKLKKRP